LAEPAKNVAGYHVLLAEVALRFKRPEEAEAQFAQASRLEPQNDSHRLNIAVLRLRSTNETVVAQARATLESLCTSTNVGLAALGWLVAERLSHNDLVGAERFSNQLLANPHSTLTDRLQHLGILRQAKSPEFAPTLAGLQQASLSNVVQVCAISSWLRGQGLAADAMRWLTNLPPKLRTEPVMQMETADCYASLKDWTGLENYLQKQKWGELEYMRFAFLSRAAAEQQQEDTADTRWRMALQQAGDRFGALYRLLGLAEFWGRAKAQEELLWRIAERFPDRRGVAFSDLTKLYALRHDTRGCNKLFAAMCNYDPADFMARNNFAATSLLLKANLSKAHEMAKELYDQRPTDVVVVSTYAYSLHLQGRTKQGIAVLEKLKPAELELPPVALYYGVMLAANGQTEKATHFLEVGRRGVLFPEEADLLKQAKRE
jgi:Flp pilus assembly protein TadD